MPRDLFYTPTYAGNVQKLSSGPSPFQSGPAPSLVSPDFGSASLNVLVPVFKSIVGRAFCFLPSRCWKPDHAFFHRDNGPSSTSLLRPPPLHLSQLEDDGGGELAPCPFLSFEMGPHKADSSPWSPTARCVTAEGRLSERRLHLVLHLCRP